jgi:hypothetical protein
LINMQEWALVHVHGTLKDYLTASPRIWLDWILNSNQPWWG